MDDIIQIKCPFDGAVLSVRNQAGIETKSVTCPICKNKYPFTQFKRVFSKTVNEDPNTEYPGGNNSTDYDGEHTSYGGDEDKTEVNGNLNFTLGVLKVVGTGKTFQLRPGRNVIGRKGQKSSADFQIDTAEKRSMSREHIVIEVKKAPTSGFVHQVSLYKEKVNKTFIGSVQLLYGDRIILNHGDLIRLPDATVRFEIPDGEETEF